MADSYRQTDRQLQVQRNDTTATDRRTDNCNWRQLASSYGRTTTKQTNDNVRYLPTAIGTIRIVNTLSQKIHKRFDVAAENYIIIVTHDENKYSLVAKFHDT